MGFLEKLKNTFFEEEYVEVEEVEKPKKEPKPIAKKIENKRKREEDKKEIVEEKKEEEVVHEDKVEKEEPVTTLTASEETSVYNYADKELLKTDTSIQYFEDDDFVDKTEEIHSVPEVKKKLYGGDPEEIYEKISYTETVSKPYSNPEAKNGLSAFKNEVANELGVPFTDYNGNLTSRQCGSVGGEMVKRMVEQYESGLK